MALPDTCSLFGASVSLLTLALLPFIGGCDRDAPAVQPVEVIDIGVSTTTDQVIPEATVESVATLSPEVVEPDSIDVAGVRVQPTETQVATNAENGRDAVVAPTNDPSELTALTALTEPDPGQVAIMQQLLGGSVEERVDAVYGLDPGPVGVKAAIDAFRSDPSPEVRLAVVEIMDGEEDPQARELLIEAMQDPDVEIVLYALGIVDSNVDSTLLQQVDLLTAHQDPEVAEYATEVAAGLRAP